MEEIKIYNAIEVAEMLHVTRRSVYSWIKDGKLKAVKIGKTWIVSYENLRDFLNKGTKSNG